MRTYTATATKEIYYKERTYRPGEPILVDENDLRILQGADVISYNEEQMQHRMREEPANRGGGPRGRRS